MTRRVTKQRGFMLVAGIFLIVIAAALVSVITVRVVGSTGASTGATTRAQALYLAHTGVERWLRQRALSNTFAGEASVAFGNGTYTTTSSANDCDDNPLGATQLSVTSIGDVSATGASAQICAVVDLLRLGGAMMVYAREDNDGLPYYRRWNSNVNSWGAEGTGVNVGDDIQFMVLKFARTRNEAILGTMNIDGQIHVQVWNGTAWGNLLELVDLPTSDGDFQSFDIEYEYLNDRAIVVYNDNSGDPNYRTWDGTAWSGATNLALPTGGEPRWIELAANPLGTSNEIAMIVLTSADDVDGMVWDGAAWSNMGDAGSFDTSAADGDFKAVDVAYEQLSGTAMFIWGNQPDDEQRYRTWDGTTLSGFTTFTIATMGGQAQWIRLVPRLGSDEMMYGVQDTGSDLHTAFWDGTGPFGTVVEHDTAVEDDQDRNFDIVFETHPNNAGEAWILWGSTTAADFTVAAQWDGAAWGGPNNLGQDAAYVVQVAHPSSGTVLAAVYEDSSSPASDRDIEAYHLTGGAAAWAQSVTPIWGGPTSGNPVQKRIDVAVERYTPIVSWHEVLP